MFEIVLNAAVDQMALNIVLRSLEPNATIADIVGSESDSVVSTAIRPTNDHKWPCSISIYSKCRTLSNDTSPILFARSAYENLGLDCITDTCGLVDGLDPHDPFWCFVSINGNWHFASTCGMPLDGPYNDGTESGTNDILLIKSVEMKNLAPRMFNAASLGVPNAG